MPGRRLGAALADLLRSMRVSKNPGLTLEDVGFEAQRIKVEQGVDLTPIAATPARDVEDLTVAEFRAVIAILRDFVRRSAVGDSAGHALIRRYATVHSLVRVLTDRETLRRMTRIDPVPMPTGLAALYHSSEPLVRSGHASHGMMRQPSVPVSSLLFGAKLVSYFYVSAHDFPADPLRARDHLVMHDSDEFVIFLGRADGAHSGTGKLPIYVEGDVDPYHHVRNPIEFNPYQWLLIDATAPHYWFAPEGTVAFFVAGSSTGAYRKAMAFRYNRGEVIPGGSYPLFPTEPAAADSAPRDHNAAEQVTQPERTSYLLGRRVRRFRDLFGISASDIPTLKEGGRGVTANIVGKIENDAVANLYVRTLAGVAEAIDVPLVELFSWDPAPPPQPHNLDEARVQSAAAARSRGEEPAVVTRLDEVVNPRRPFAVVPHYVDFAASTASEIRFFEGTADVILLSISGALDVYVVADPLLFALELANDPQWQRSESESKAAWRLGVDRLRMSPFVIESAFADELVKRGLLHRDTVYEKHVFHFNAAHPHAVVPSSRNLGAGNRFLAVTVRNDVHLPIGWKGAAENHAKTDNHHHH